MAAAGLGGPGEGRFLVESRAPFRAEHSPLSKPCGYLGEGR